MSSLTSLIEQLQSSADGSNTADLYEQVFEYYTSSDVLDDYEHALRQLDQTLLTNADLWLLFHLFHLITDRLYYNNAQRDRLCYFWLPIYRSFIEQLLPEHSSDVEDNVDHERLLVLKYLLANMIEMQKTSESIDHIVEDELQFQNFTQKDQYFAIIKLILPLLTNSSIVERLDKDDLQNIKLEWQPNDLSNITNITTTSVLWMVLKLTMMFMKTDGDCLTLAKHDKSLKQTLLTSSRLIKNNEPIILFLHVTAALLINDEDMKNEINDPMQIIATLTVNIQDIVVSDNEQTKFSLHGVHILDMIIALKAYLQHDQVKAAFMANDGLQLLIEIVNNAWPDALDQIQSNFHHDVLERRREVELLAFECLSVMSFDKDAASALRNNDKLMSRIRNLVDENDPSSARVSESLKRTLDGLQWKLEGEDQFKSTQPTEEEGANEFDLMISYSWSDKPLVREIYEHLSDAYQYQIWLDENQVTGSLSSVMAQAVDQSKIVLMCMSETYKASENCRNAAEYARARKKPVIPLIVKEIEPDGWLGSISAGKTYVDFVTQDFAKAMQVLVAEIQRNPQIASKEKPSSLRLTTTAPIPRPVVSSAYANISMVSWSDEDVRDFLHGNKLGPMALLTEHMNGEELTMLIDQCSAREKYWTTFDRLNQEMEKRFQQTLPLSIYVRFLHRSQKYYTQTSSF